MKLPPDTTVAAEKIIDYLLTWRPRNDKSQWLAGAGYQKDDWQRLKRDLEDLIARAEAYPAETTRWGQMFEIKEKLLGPNGKTLLTRSYWMTESASGLAKFITLYPDKGA